LSGSAPKLSGSAPNPRTMYPLYPPFREALSDKVTLFTMQTILAHAVKIEIFHCAVLAFIYKRVWNPSSKHYTWINQFLATNSSPCLTLLF